MLSRNSERDNNLNFGGEIASVGLQPEIGVIIDHLLITFTVNCRKTFYKMNVTISDYSKRRLLSAPVVQTTVRLFIYYHTCSRSPTFKELELEMEAGIFLSIS